MSYETFLSEAKIQVAFRLGPQYQLSILKIPKNNGLIQDSLYIASPPMEASPAVHLNSFYQQLKEGRSAEDIWDEIAWLLRHAGLPSFFDPNSLNQPEFIRSRIAFKLIHRDSNQSLLHQLPHQDVLDLSMVYYLYLGEDHQEQAAITIRSSHLQQWGMDLEQLKKLAAENTPRLFPPRIFSVQSLLEQSCQCQIPETDLPLWGLTNLSGINGSAVMLYPDILKNFANRLEDDLVILPSSVHEVLILPAGRCSNYEDLSAMVTEINQLQVPSEDRLSNQVYLYRRRWDRLQIAARSPQQLQD